MYCTNLQLYYSHIAAYFHETSKSLTNALVDNQIFLNSTIQNQRFFHMCIIDYEHIADSGQSVIFILIIIHDPSKSRP